MEKTTAFYSVYCFTNNINSKKYIGITSDIKRRFKQHKGMRSRAVVFCLAIKKHGFENFKFKILKENLTLEDAKIFEVQFIQELNSMVPNGYNRTKGGDSSVKHTIASIEKIKEKNRLYRLNNPDPRKGKKHSEETKKIMSKLASERINRPRGNRHWNYGKKTSDLSKQKMSISQTLGNNGFAKKVIDLNTNIVYSCISEAKQVYSISHSFISMVCTGKRKSDKYNFKYLKDYEQKKCLTVTF